MHPHKEIALLHTFLPFFFRWAAFPLPIFSLASSLMFRISPCSTPPITSVNPASRSLWSSCCPHCERLPQKRPFRSEVKIVPWRVGVRVRKREDCSDALSLLFFFTFTKHTHIQARLPMVHSHFAFSGAQLATLSSALRGRAWRLER